MDWLQTGIGNPSVKPTGAFKGANPVVNPGSLGAFLMSAGDYARNLDGSRHVEGFQQKRAKLADAAKQQAEQAQGQGMLAEILRGATPETQASYTPSPAENVASQTMAVLGKETYKPGNKQSFIQAMMPHAQRVSQQTGIDPRLVIAQAAQETGWGKSAPGGNFFGIKSHGRDGGQTVGTHEYVDGNRVSMQDSFRTYGGMGESADDYARFLQENPRYGEMLSAQGLDAQVDALGRSGYATDPNYANSIRSIASGIGIPQQSGMSPERAAAILSSPNVPAAAKQMVMQQFQGQQPVKGVEINGRLVNPYTGKEIANFSQGSKPTAAQQKIGRLEALGIPNDTATKIADGVYRTVTDPITREMQVLDLATGQIVQTISPQQVSTPAEAQTPEITPQQTPIPSGAEEAFGLGGSAKGIVNTVSDALGAGEVFPEVAEHQRYFRVLEEDLLVDLSQAYGRMPAARLMERLRKLGPQAGTLEGANAAQGELDALETRFSTDLETARKSTKRRMSPADRAAAVDRISGLEAALGRIRGAQSRFGSSEPNTTSSGVTWSIVD